VIPLLPEPLNKPEGMLNHDAELDEIHGQPEPMVKVIVPVLPSAGRLRLVGLTVGVHPAAAPAWANSMSRPATVRVAVRAEVVGFVAAMYVISVLPTLLAPEATVSHDALLDEVHEQLPSIVTASKSITPEAGTLMLVEWTVGVQAPPAPCTTVTVCPAMVREPVRELLAVLLLTVNETVPLPVPP